MSVNKKIKLETLEDVNKQLDNMWMGQPDVLAAAKTLHSYNVPLDVILKTIDTVYCIGHHN